MTKISVVMPVLNAAPHLAQAIDSILCQTHADIDFVIVDDGSRDASPAIIDGYAKLDRRIRPLFLEPGAHISGARATNAGIAVASGDLIARMDSDDIAVPHKLATQLDYMQAHGLDICGSEMETFGARKKAIWFPNSHEAMCRELLFRIALPNPAMLTRRDILLADPFNEAVGMEDYELQTRLALKYRMGNVSQALILHRVWPGQSTKSNVLRLRRDIAASRMPFFFARYPNARLQDLVAVGRLADREPFEDAEQAALGGSWLVRLADYPDPKLRARMARRWIESEYLLAELSGAGSSVFEHFAKLLQPN